MLKMYNLALDKEAINNKNFIPSTNKISHNMAHLNSMQNLSMGILHEKLSLSPR